MSEVREKVLFTAEEQGRLFIPPNDGWTLTTVVQGIKRLFPTCRFSYRPCIPLKRDIVALSMAGEEREAKIVEILEKHVVSLEVMIGIDESGEPIWDEPKRVMAGQWKVMAPEARVEVTNHVVGARGPSPTAEVKN